MWLKIMENHGKSWKNHGKIMENHGKNMENHEKSSSVGMIFPFPI